jgi:uncharacterized iron-regulated protein
MNEINDFKKEIFKKIKELQYKIKKLLQLNDELLKKNIVVTDMLNNSRSRNAKVLAENFKLKKIIVGQKRKIEEDGFVETDEEMEMPLFLNKPKSK